MLDKQAQAECCTNNLTMDSWTTLRKSETQVDQQYCLQRCGVCHDRPFVVVDGETICGESYEEILNQISEPELED